MEEKKEIKIKLSTAIMILIIILLAIALIGILLYDNNKDVEEQNVNSVQSGNISNDNNVAQTNETSNESNVTQSNATQNNETTELTSGDSVGTELLEKINFPTYAVASIYKEGSFNLNTISNDLILRLGWSKVSSDDKNDITDEEVTNYVISQTVKADILKESIETIFGSNINYTNATFTNIDVETFDEYEENEGVIVYNNGIYTADYIEGGGGDAPFIHQEIQNISKSDNKIEMYVKTVFIDTEYIESDDSYSYNYIIYKDYDFNNDKFKNKLKTTTDSDFYKAYDDTTNHISWKNNSDISQIIDEANTYVYTFELDETTGEYYLSGFEAE